MLPPNACGTCWRTSNAGRRGIGPADGFTSSQRCDLATAGRAAPVSFRWKAHPIELRSTVVAAERPRSFAIVADALRMCTPMRAFTLRPTPDGRGTVVVSHETQVGPLAWLGRAILAPRLRAANQAMFDDLARAAATATPAATHKQRTDERKGDDHESDDGNNSLGEQHRRAVCRGELRPLKSEVTSFESGGNRPCSRGADWPLPRRLGTGQDYRRRVGVRTHTICQ